MASSASSPTSTDASLLILIIGGGGREHALAWKLAQSRHVQKIFVAPGNGGTASGSKISDVAIGADNFSALVDFAVKNKVSIYA